MERGDGGLLFDAVFDNETVEIPAIFHQRGLDELMVSVGSSGMGLPFHNHAAAWQRVVSGEKLFLFLCGNFDIMVVHVFPQLCTTHGPCPM